MKSTTCVLVTGVLMTLAFATIAAPVLAQVGDLDSAFGLLELGLAAGRIEAWIAVDPDLESLLVNPRWQVLVDELRVRLEGSGS